MDALRLTGQVASMQQALALAEERYLETIKWRNHANVQFAAQEWRIFGPLAFAFASLHDGGGPRFLVLLHLGDESRAAAIINDAYQVVRSSSCEEGIRNLMRDSHWHSHLLAALGMLESERPERYRDLLWERIDMGSWVSPQLAATASIIDPEFAERAVRWISKPPVPSQDHRFAIPHSTDFEEWSTPDEISYAFTAKAVNAMLGLLPDRQKAAELGQEQHVRERVEGDPHDGAGIAVRWRGIMVSQVEAATGWTS